MLILFIMFILFSFFIFILSQKNEKKQKDNTKEYEYEDKISKILRERKNKRILEIEKKKQQEIEKEKNKRLDLENKYNELKKIFSYPDNKKYEFFFDCGLFTPNELVNQFFNGAKNTIQGNLYILFLKKEKQIFEELFDKKQGKNFTRFNFFAYYFYKEIDILKSIESALLYIYSELNYIAYLHPYLDDDYYEDILSSNIENVFIPNHMVEFLSENKKIYKQNKDLIFSKFKEYQLPYLYITINDFQIISNNIVNNENVDIELILKKKKNNKKYKINKH